MYVSTIDVIGYLDSVLHSFCDVVSFLSDLLTVVLALVTLWGLYKHRDDISALFKYARFRRRNFLVSQAKSCLRALEEAQQKRSRDKESIVHLGELAGLLRNLTEEFRELSAFSAEVDKYVDSHVVPTTAVIKRLTTELNGRLDRLADNEIGNEKDEIG